MEIKTKITEALTMLGLADPLTDAIKRLGPRAAALVQRLASALARHTATGPSMSQ